MGLIVVGAGPARAQQYPTKTITIIVGFLPGGLADVLARVIGQRLGERLGQTVVIENRAGAGGNIAHRLVAGAQPDGHTLLMATTSLAINEALYKTKGYSASDFATVLIAASTPEILTTNPNRRESTLKDFVELSKTQPVNFGTAGAGSASSVVMDYLFKVLAKVPAVHVPFQGATGAFNALAGNHIDLAASATAGGVVELINNKTLRGVAIAAEKRLSSLPDTPTYIEAGYPGFIASAWAGFFAPARTPPAVLEKLNAVINEIVREPAIADKIRSIGPEPMQATQPETERLFKSEVEKWSNMVRTLGMSVE
jgi:tripartite-type tricarboxylate transporter receptor subunit TctC